LPTVADGDQGDGAEAVPPAVWPKEKKGVAALLAGLDPDQRAAAEARPLMIIAGPGTGKTREHARLWTARDRRFYWPTPVPLHNSPQVL